MLMLIQRMCTLGELHTGALSSYMKRRHTGTEHYYYYSLDQSGTRKEDRYNPDQSVTSKENQLWTNSE